MCTFKPESQLLKRVYLNSRMQFYFFFSIQHSTLILQFLNYVTVGGF